MAKRRQKPLDPKLLAKLKQAPKVKHTFTVNVEIGGESIIIAKGKVTNIRPTEGDRTLWQVEGIVGQLLREMPQKKYFDEDHLGYLPQKQVMWGGDKVLNKGKARRRSGIRGTG